MAIRELDDLVALAQRFAALEMHDEAVTLLRVAVRLDPGNGEYAHILTDAEAATPLAKSAPAAPQATADDRARQRTSIDACHFFGLAMLYTDRGEVGRAIECLQMSKEKMAVLPFPYKLHGRLLFQQKDFPGAARELRKALRFNPFDREVAETLGQVEYERKSFAEALEATVDAYLLLRDENAPSAPRLRRRIRTLKRLLNWDNRVLTSLFHERQQHLATAFDRLQWRRDLILEEKGVLERGLFGAQLQGSGGSRIAMAGRLRAIELWSDLPDEAIFQLTSVAREEQYAEGGLVFELGDSGTDLFFMVAGRLGLKRPTPYGSFIVRELLAGEMFGEMNFVSPASRSCDAIALEPATVIRIEASGLRRFIHEHPEPGLEIYNSLWHALARKLRMTNEYLKTFFPAGSVDALPENRSPIGGAEALSPKVGQVDSRETRRLFQEQGLSRHEVLTLATFGEERHYDAGAYIFREGSPGEEMFVVLDGRIRISKIIPGAGEEALSIMERGGFFGEMALIDGQPRSADARTHSGPAKLLVLDRATVREVLSMDPHASLEFVELLCRILASRLRELDEKVVMWQILAGHQDTAAPGDEP